MKPTFCFWLLLICLSWTLSHARIIKFENQEYVQQENKPLSISTSVGIFSPADAPISAPPGNGRAFADFQLNITGVNPSYNQSVVGLLFIPYTEIDDVLMDDADNDQKHLCLSDGNLAIQPRNVEQSHGIFEEIQLPGIINKRFNVSYSSMYFMYIIKCDVSQDPGFVINGNVMFMNPFGHIKGEFYGILPFYAVLTFIMLISGTLWSGLMLRYRKELTTVQWMISGMLLLTLVEFIFLFSDAVYENNIGNRSRVLEAFSVLLTLGRKTASRVLVLIVCMGYGVAVPKLGSKMFWVFIYGGMYFSFGCLFEIAKQLFYDSGAASVAMVTLSSVPVAVLDGGFYAWIFVSLATTIQTLQNENQQAKLKIYNRLKYTLIFYVVASIIWVLIEILFRIGGSFYAYWPMIWTFECIWDLLFVVVFMVIMLYWRPSPNSHLYAYAQELSTMEQYDAEEDELFEL